MANYGVASCCAAIGQLLDDPAETLPQKALFAAAPQSPSLDALRGSSGSGAGHIVAKAQINATGSAASPSKVTATQASSPPARPCFSNGDWIDVLINAADMLEGEGLDLGVDLRSGVKLTPVTLPRSGPGHQAIFQTMEPQAALELKRGHHVGRSSVQTVAWLHGAGLAVPSGASSAAPCGDAPRPDHSFASACRTQPPAKVLASVSTCSAAPSLGADTCNHTWAAAAAPRRNLQLLGLLGLPVEQRSLRLGMPYISIPTLCDGVDERNSSPTAFEVVHVMDLWAPNGGGPGRTGEVQAGTSSLLELPLGYLASSRTSSSDAGAGAGAFQQRLMDKLACGGGRQGPSCLGPGMREKGLQSPIACSHGAGGVMTAQGLGAAPGADSWRQGRGAAASGQAHRLGREGAACAMPQSAQLPQQQPPAVQLSVPGAAWARGHLKDEETGLWGATAKATVDMATSPAVHTTHIQVVGVLQLAGDPRDVLPYTVEWLDESLASECDNCDDGEKDRLDLLDFAVGDMPYSDQLYRFGYLHDGNKGGESVLLLGDFTDVAREAAGAVAGCACNWHRAGGYTAGSPLRGGGGLPGSPPSSHRVASLTTAEVW